MNNNSKIRGYIVFQEMPEHLDFTKLHVKMLDTIFSWRNHIDDNPKIHILSEKALAILRKRIHNDQADKRFFVMVVKFLHNWVYGQVLKSERSSISFQMLESIERALMTLRIAQVAPENPWVHNYPAAFVEVEYDPESGIITALPSTLKPFLPT